MGRSHALLFSFWPVEQSIYRSARLWRSAHGRRRFHRSLRGKGTSFCHRFLRRVRPVGVCDASGTGACSTVARSGSDASGMIMSLAWDTSSEVVNTGWERFSPGPIGCRVASATAPFVFAFATSFEMAARSMPTQIDSGRFTRPRFCLISTTKGRLLLHSALGGLGGLRTSSKPIARRRPPAPTHFPHQPSTLMVSASGTL